MKIQAFRDKLCSDYIKQFIIMYTSIYPCKSYLLISFSERKSIWLKVFQLSLRLWSGNEKQICVRCVRYIDAAQRNLLNHVDLRLTGGRRASLHFEGNTHPPSILCTHLYSTQAHGSDNTMSKWTMATARTGLLSTTIKHFHSRKLLYSTVSAMEICELSAFIYSLKKANKHIDRSLSKTQCRKKN